MIELIGRCCKCKRFEVSISDDTKECVICRRLKNLEEAVDELQNKRSPFEKKSINNAITEVNKALDKVF